MQTHQHFSNQTAPKPGTVEAKPVRFIRLPEVRAITGLSRSQIYRLESNPVEPFPKHVKLGAAASAWLESEVLQWCADRIAASRGAAA
jgi:prophage regulatory protein